MEKNHQSNVMLFLNSYYGEEIKKGVYKFHLNNPIQARRGNIIKVEMMKFEIPISMYNLTSLNNKLDIKVTYINSGEQTETFNIIFPEKNYNINELLAYINGLTYSNIILSASFDSQRLKLTITASHASFNINKVEILDTSNCSRKLGLLITDEIINSSNTQSLALEGTNIVNLSFPQVIFIKTDLKLQNRDSYGELSSILAKIQIDKPFGEILHYKDESPVNFDIADEYIDHLNIQLLDDDFNLIDANGANFHTTISFTFHNKSYQSYEGTLLDKIDLQEKIIRDNNNYDDETEE